MSSKTSILNVYRSNYPYCGGAQLYSFNLFNFGVTTSDVTPKRGRHFQMYLGTNTDTITQTPEPTAMLLLGTGLVGLAAGIRRKRKNRK